MPLGKTLGECRGHCLWCVGIHRSEKASVCEADIQLFILFKNAAKNVSSVAEKMEKTITLIQEDLTITMKKFKETSENMEDFSRIIKDNPSLLLREGNKQERGR